MILQINKELPRKGLNEGKVAKRIDYLDKVVRANCIDEEYVMVEFLNGDIHSYTNVEPDNKDHWFKVDCAQEMHEYQIKSMWLLNDEGKTLKRLI